MHGRLSVHTLITALFPRLIYCRGLLCLIAALSKCYFAAVACGTLLLHLSWYYYVSLLPLFMAALLPFYYSTLWDLSAELYSEYINPFALSPMLSAQACGTFPVLVLLPFHHNSHKCPGYSIIQITVYSHISQP